MRSADVPKVLLRTSVSRIEIGVVAERLISSVMADRSDSTGILEFVNPIPANE